jgi:hypothetical protein
VVVAVGSGGSPVVAVALALALLVVTESVVGGALVVGVSVVPVSGRAPVGLCVVDEAVPPPLSPQARTRRRGAASSERGLSMVSW